MPPKQEYEPAQEQEHTDFMQGWAEPALKEPVPSFMDHRGLERVGVLEHMMPLGTMPSAKVKARAKADPLRKTMQPQNMAGMLMEDLRSTPDMLSTPGEDAGHSMAVNPMTASHMAGTAMMVDDNNMFGGFPLGSLQLPPDYQAAYQMPLQAMQQLAQLPNLQQMQQLQQMQPFQPMQPYQPMPVQASMQAMQSTFPVVSQTPASRHQSTTTPGQRAGSNGTRATPSSASSLEHSVRKATRLAHQAGSPHLEYHLSQLQAAAAQDPELATLLNFAVTNNSLDERGSAINRKLKALKTAIKASGASPVTQGSANVGQPVKSGSPSQSVFQPSPGSMANLDALIASANQTHTPTSKKMKSRSRNADAMNGVQIDPSLNLGGGFEATPRRGSSSSLSSIDESLAAGPPPVISQIGLTADDVETEATRKRMSKSFNDVQVNESSVRQPPAKKQPSRRGGGSAKSKVPKAQATSTQTQSATGTPGLPGDAAGVDGAAPASTPPPPTALGRPPKRLKTAAKIKISPVKNRQPAVIAGIARPDIKRQSSAEFDAKSQASENNDYCSACGGTGFLLCCDGCDRSFHFTCLDPPQHQEAILDEPWFCYMCQSRAANGSFAHGLFSELQRHIAGKNPSSFKLPLDIRDYFEGVKTGEQGEYAEAQTQRATIIKGRPGYDEPSDYQKLKDAKGSTITCYQCGESALEHSDIVPCDYCTANWHLDCLNPPLAYVPYRSHLNHKTKPLWMCPLHIDHDLRNLDTIEGDGVAIDGHPAIHRTRRPKKPRVKETFLRRGFVNNGLIEVADDSDDEGDMTDEEGPYGVIYKVPARGIKLDFIDKAKSNRLIRAALASDEAAKYRQQTARLQHANQVALASDIAKRHIHERKTVLNLAQLSTQNGDINLGTTELDRLLYALEAEAPEEVVKRMRRSETQAAASPFKLDYTGNVVATKEEATSQHLRARERDMLLKLQRLIERVLDWRPPVPSIEAADEDGDGDGDERMPDGYSDAEEL